MAEEMTLTEWLKTLNLQQYVGAINEAGADNLGDLRDLDEGEMKELANECKMKKLHAKKFEKAWKTLIGDGKSELDCFLEECGCMKYKDAIIEQGLTNPSDLKSMNDEDIKQLLTAAKVGILFKKKFIELSNLYKNGEYDPSSEEKKEEKEEDGDIVDISEYLGKEEPPQDVEEFIDCAACKGKGWFARYGPVHAGDSDKKCKCGCCDGSGKMPKDYVECWRCKGKGNFARYGVVHAGDSDKRLECPLCGGGCYFSSTKNNAIKNNGTRNTKCPPCKGMGSFASYGPVHAGDTDKKSECTACDGCCLIIDHFSKCEPCKGLGYFASYGPVHIGDSDKKVTCSACNGKAYIDLRGMYKCVVCKGKGSFASYGACHCGDSDRKIACSCCDGKVYISDSRKNKCDKCKGKGWFANWGPCHVGDSDKKEACSACNGKIYSDE